MVLYPAWDPPRRARNIQWTALVVCVVLATASAGAVAWLTVQRNAWGFGRCALAAFSSPCHVCWEDPMWEERCAGEEADNRHCWFEVRIEQIDGTVYSGPYTVEWEIGYWSQEFQVKERPFECCPVDDTCCSWMVVNRGNVNPEHRRFCDQTCHGDGLGGGQGGWPCRFRIEDGAAKAVEYYILGCERQVAVAIFLATSLLALACARKLRPKARKPNAGSTRPARIEVEALTSPTPAGGEEPSPRKSPLGKRWGPKEAREALRPILSPEVRGAAPAWEKRRGVAWGPRSPKANAVPSASRLEPRKENAGLPAPERWMEHTSEPRPAPAPHRPARGRALSADMPAERARHGVQTALARADWAAARREAAHPRDVIVAGLGAVQVPEPRAVHPTAVPRRDFASFR